jgi:hypothetical protein
MPISVEFQNNSDKQIIAVHVDIFESGVGKGGHTFEGAFSPGADVSKVYLDPDAARIADPAGLSCVVTFARFSSGEGWHAASALANIINQPESPVTIRDCSVSAMAGDAPDYNERIFVTFMNSSDKPITAIKFQFALFDAFETHLTSVTGTVYGHFSAQAVVEPYTNSGGEVYNASSPAWRYYFGPGSKDSVFRSIGPTDIATSKCSVLDVRFEDGTIWKADGADAK